MSAAGMTAMLSALPRTPAIFLIQIIECVAVLGEMNKLFEDDLLNRACLIVLEDLR